MNLSTPDEAQTRLQVQDAVISFNKAQQGSAICLIALNLESDSYIRNTTFKNNDSINQDAERGTVYLEF